MSGPDGRLYWDLDIQENYETLERAALQPSCLNFVVEFDSERATAAVDLKAQDIKNVLEKKRARGTATRWINIFAPDQQVEAIKHIARFYSFSPRLAGIMCSSHQTARSLVTLSSTLPSFSTQSNLSRRHRASSPMFRSSESPDSDLELQKVGTVSGTGVAALDLSHYKLVNEVWHYTSVDWGSDYLCIGYNSLTHMEHELVNHTSKQQPGEKTGDGHHPSGKRVWMWVILCNDGTVMSMLEDPFPACRRNWTVQQIDDLKIIRRNLLTVIRQLSNVKRGWRTSNAMYALDIRPGMQSNHQNSNVTISDSSSLLFYYLFDDWYTSYALVAKKEQQYASRLEDLRNHMFKQPDLDLMESLHQTGRQLSVLKRIYQGYALIITRILEKQRPSDKVEFAKSTRFSEIGDSLTPAEDTKSAYHSGPKSSEDHFSTVRHGLGPPLPQAAIVRFERLLDRINLYALSEIQECLDEKNDLVFLNFNLITLKESYAVEKLTRITIILAKATILFLPVSLMTAYFSIQLADIAGKYTIKTYWASFAVIVSLSFVFLLSFGWISGTIEGKVLYRSTLRTVFDVGRNTYTGMRVGRQGNRL